MNSIRFLMEMRKLMNIKRFQNKLRIAKTTVADHEWSVTRIAFWLAQMDEDFFGKTGTDYKLLLEKALHHDTMKLYTGDIQANRGNAEVVQYSREKLFPMVFDSIIKPMIPHNVVDDYKRIIIDAMDGTYEGRLVYIANKIDKIHEANDEIRLGNKKYFNPVKYRQLRTIKEEIERNQHVSGFNSAKMVLGGLIKEDGSHYARMVISGVEKDYYIHHEGYEKFSKYIDWGRDLIHTERYQNLTKLIKRNVASHQWSVSVIAYFIALHVEEEKGIKVDYKRLIMTAIEHDAIESSTGDILSHTKRMTPEMVNLVEESEHNAFNNVVKPMLPIEWHEYFGAMLLNPKSLDVEGDIIRASDALDLIFECVEEIEVGNRNLFSKMIDDKLSSIKDIDFEIVKQMCEHLEFIASKIK